MLDQAFGSQLHATGDPVARRMLEWQRLALVATCGAVAAVVGTAVAQSAYPAGWVSIARMFGIVFVAFFVAACVLRVMDAVALRQQIAARGNRAARLAEETRALAQARHPGIEDRASQIDAAALVGRVVHPHKESQPPNQSST